MIITASIVLFNTPREKYEVSINSFLNECAGVIYVIDNSPIANNSKFFTNKRIKYYHYPENLGFGRGHNIALFQYIKNSDFHICMNPDIEILKNTLTILIEILFLNDSIGAVMPKIIYPNGKLQEVIKLIPTPLNLIARRFFKNSYIISKLNRGYELTDKIKVRIEIPILSGCFFIARTSIIRKIGFFDDRFFMYMEDVDLSRKILNVSKILYEPSALVIHEYAKGSYQNIKLLTYHIYSAIKYFNKWGWIFDYQRKIYNNKFISDVKKQ